MRFDVGVCFALLVATCGVAQNPKEPALVVACVDTRASYAPSETVHLTVAVENRGTSPFYVYRPLEWGWTGLWFGVLDATGKPVRPKQPLIAPLPPPPLSDRSELVEVDPGYFYGRHLDFALSAYDLNPGTYFIAFKYRSEYHQSDGFGLPMLSWEDGEIVAHRIEFFVR
jgi:hypothetical protein